MTTQPRQHRGRDAEWWIAILAAAAAAAVLAVGTLVGMNVDEDELGTSVLTTMLQAQAVWHGHLPFWTSRIGFGLPQPGAQSFFIHPLMPLFAWCDPYTAVMGLYAVHIVVGALGFWWLCRTMKLSTVTTGVCTATFLLSSPALQYTQTAFYPTYFVTWTLAPFVLGLIIRMLADDRPDARIAVVLGIAAGLMLANGHLGHAPFLLATLAFGAAAYPARVRERGLWLALAAVIAIAIGSYHFGTMLDEYVRFPSSLARWDDETLTAGSLWDVFFRPLTPETIRRLMAGQPQHLGTFLLWRGTHVIFFGGPFALLAIAALIWRRAAHPWRPLFAAVVGSSLLLMAVSSAQRLDPISATYLLRDGIVIGGIGLAGIALDGIRDVGGPRLVVHAIVAAQLFVMAASAEPFVARSLDLARAYRSNGRDAVMRALTARLAEPGRRDAGRVYLTSAPTLGFADDQSPTGFEPHVNWGVDRAIVWYTQLTSEGVRAINGLFKGTSTQSLMPSSVMPYGWIDSDPSLSVSAPSLSVLGIRSVVALEGERVAGDLEAVESWPTPRGRLRLLDNPRAWPGARFVRPSAFDGTLPVLPGCPHDRLLCRDLTPVLTAAEEPVSAVRYGEGTITVDFAPATRARALLVTEMFHEGWYALANGTRLPVTPAWGALMRVDVPAGASSVELRYRPVWQLALAAFSWSATLIAVLLTLGPWLRRNSGA